jgi:hypothetical protein
VTPSPHWCLHSVRWGHRVARPSPVTRVHGHFPASALQRNCDPTDHQAWPPVSHNPVRQKCRFGYGSEDEELLGMMTTGRCECCAT